MTTPLNKTVRRRLKIRGVDYVIELTAAGILFRPLGGRRRMVVPWFDVLSRAYAHTGVQDRREQLRTAALARVAGKRRIT